VPGFDVFSWFGFFVPARTPQDVGCKAQCRHQLAALVYPQVKSRFEELGATPKGSTQAELARLPEIGNRQMGPGDPGGGKSGSKTDHGTAGAGGAARSTRQG